MDLGPDKSDEEQDDGHQKDDEYRHMVSVVKVSKDELEVDGIHGLEEASPVAAEVVCLTLCPDPHIVLEQYLDRGTVRPGGNRKIESHRDTAAIPLLRGGVEIITT